MNDGHRIPHLLPCVAVASHVDLLDGVDIGPRDVTDDLLGLILNALPHLHRRENHFNLLRPEAEKGLGKGDALSKVEVWLDGVAEHAAHDVEAFDFLPDKFHAVQRRDVVAL